MLFLFLACCCMRGGGVFGLDEGTMNAYMQKYGHSSIRVIFIVYANFRKL